MTELQYIGLALCSPIIILILAVVGFILGFLCVSVCGYVINKYLNLAIYLLKGLANESKE